MKRIFLTAVAAAVLSGCSSGVNIPSDLSDDLNRDNATKLYEKQWKQDEPPITFVPLVEDMHVHRTEQIPEKVLDSNISIKIAKQRTVKDLVVMFKSKGLYLIVPDEELAKKPISLFVFDGRFGDYLTALENAYGLSFNYKTGNIIIAEQLSDFILKIPQNEDVAKQIASDIKALGGEDVSYSLNAATVYYKATKKANILITDHLERLSYNTSLVSLQVAIINVQIDRDIASGVDWSQFNLGFGSSASSETSADSSSDDEDDSDDDDDSDSTETSTTTGNSLADLALNGTLSGKAADLTLYKGNFSLSTVIDFLSTYGKANASQNLIMKTLSGNGVKMNVGDKVPYIDELGSTSDTDSDSESSDVSVSYLDIGTKLDLKPWYDNQDQLITINCKLEVSSLTKWVTLNAGNTLGEVEQPQTREQTFEDVIKMSAGETVIVGGISYDEYSDDRNAPFFAEAAGIAHKDESLSKNATYIMIRPTVTVFGRSK